MMAVQPLTPNRLSPADGLDLSLPPGVRFFQESPGVVKTVRVGAPMNCGKSAGLNSVQKVEENLSAEEAAELEERELVEYMRSFGLEREKEGPRGGGPAALDKPAGTCSGGKKKSNAELAAISKRIAAKTVAARTRRREATAAAGGGGEAGAGAGAEGGLGQKREQEGKGKGKGKGKNKRGKRGGKEEEEEEEMSPGERAAIARAAERRKEMGLTDDGGHGGEL